MLRFLTRSLDRERTHDYASCVLAVMSYLTMCYLLISSKPIPGEFLGIVGVITGYYFRVVTQPTPTPHEHTPEHPAGSAVNPPEPIRRSTG